MYAVIRSLISLGDTECKQFTFAYLHKSACHSPDENAYIESLLRGSFENNSPMQTEEKQVNGR